MKKKSEKIQKIVCCCILSFCVLTIFSCATTSAETPVCEYNETDYILENPHWQNATENGEIQFFDFENPLLPLRYTIAKVQLASKNLSIVTYPDSETAFFSQKKFTHKGISISDFQKKTKAQLSVNTTQYFTPNDFGIFSAKRRLLGIFNADNILFSEPVPRYAALVLEHAADGGFTARCIAHQSEELCKNDFAIGGFFLILQNGALFDSSGNNFSYTSRDARTAAGVSSDGQILYVLSVSGSKKQHSAGLTYPECARLLKKIGAENALEFDGGSSTAMMICSKNVLKSQIKRKNAGYIGFLFEIKSTF